jgi:hypothetical protein
MSLYNQGMATVTPTVSGKGKSNMPGIASIIVVVAGFILVPRIINMIAPSK